MKTEWEVFENSGYPQTPFGHRLYSVLHDNIALFRSFSEIGQRLVPPGKDYEKYSPEIESFIENYGDLWKPKKAEVPPDWPPMRPPFEPMLAHCQACEMNVCVQLWGYIQAGDDAELAKHIQWKINDLGDFEAHLIAKTTKIASAVFGLDAIHIISVKPATKGGVRPGDLRIPATIYVKDRINHYIHAAQTHAVVTKRDGIKFRLIPKNLIEGLWFQFAQAVAEGKDFGKCNVCGSWFEISKTASRKTRRYCSDSCKFKAFWAARKAEENSS